MESIKLICGLFVVASRSQDEGEFIGKTGTGCGAATDGTSKGYKVINVNGEGQ